MFDEITEIRRIRKKYNQAMFRSEISTFRKFEDLEADALKDGALSRKNKELVALGISITQKCYGWIEFHVSSAADLGATRGEILETAAVALALNGGPAEWPIRFVFKVLEELQRSKEENEGKR